MFAYGLLSVILVLYLSELGFNEIVIGGLLSLTLIGDSVISLIMTTTADRFSRKRILIFGASLMLFAGTLFAFTTSLPLLLIAAIVGVVSPSGHEVGPFLAVEQPRSHKRCPTIDARASLVGITSRDRWRLPSVRSRGVGLAAFCKNSGRRR
jgi:MFS family permease